jgi:hypothetical protein
MGYVNARRMGEPDDAIECINLMHASMPAIWRDKTPLSELELDNSLHCKLNAPRIKWAWCSINLKKVEKALSDHRAEIIKQLGNENK